MNLESFKKMQKAIINLSEIRLTSNDEIKEVREFMENALVDLVKADEKILKELSIQNLRDIFEQADCLYDVERNVRDITKLLTACEEKNTKDYAIMTNKKHDEEHWFWSFEEVGEEEVAELEKYRLISTLSRFKYVCDKDLELDKYKFQKDTNKFVYVA